MQLECARVVRGPRRFARARGGEWLLELAVPPLSRLEYRLVIFRGPRVERVLDPGNPRIVATPDGPRSVLELSGTNPAEWTRRPAGGRLDPMRVPGCTTEPVPVTVWTPPQLGDEETAGLVLVHDGPEYAEYAGLARLSADLITRGALPPHRLALLHPEDRDQWYSGSVAYLDAVTGPVLDTLLRRYATAGPVVTAGASLGGLTAVLAALWRGPHTPPGRIGGVIAQSGSFFTADTDPQERGYRHFPRIAAMVAEVARTPAQPPLEVGLTCGALEENAENNRRMAAALRAAGHHVTYWEGSDLHTFQGWRDAIEPAWCEVLGSLWQTPSASLAGAPSDH